ncbi:Crp/Fnr family transcriptional regulator [Streptomyces apocyni]|uniref:Crp/Fnr family transcriptional regulator n=1 Tax=Streptomyces apocyni TaxID=2654677 RepID=UPI0012EAC712|nr:Crp/Fnr family transcriptional regulator [Streptomyces apocyni]
MDAGIRAAVQRSHLRALPDDVLDGLMARAVRTRIPRGSVTHREGEDPPHLELVVSGVVRVFVTAQDGRTMTIRYCRSGALIGAISLFATGFAMPASTQALVDAELLRLSPPAVQRAVTRDVRVAHALLGELADRALGFARELQGSAFATVRERVARHLLDLASERAAHPEDLARREFVVSVSQRELAEAVGTVREVVVRVLRELREDGVVRTGRDRIVIVDPLRLVQEQGWNSRH